MRNRWGFPYRSGYDIIKEGTVNILKAFLLFLFFLILFLLIALPSHAAARDSSQRKGVSASSRAVRLTASWYSEASLKQEGTWEKSKGVMANGQRFDETDYTCATRLYPLGTILKISHNGKTVYCEVTDRIGKRFAKTRIDLSKAAFQQIASLKQGLVEVEVMQ